MISIVLVCLLIWIVGPFLAVADYRPLDSAGVRATTILIVSTIWALVFHGELWRVWLCVAAGLLALFETTISYRGNQVYLQNVQQAVAVLKGDDESSGGDLPSKVLRMDRLRQVVTVAEEHKDHVPLSMRWGLYQGDNIAEAARDAYFRELNTSLLPFAAHRLEQRIGDLIADPDRLFEYLKAYLMLAEPQRVEHDDLLAIVRAELGTMPSSDAALSERLERHFSVLISDPRRMGPVPVDAQSIAQARASLAHVSLPGLIYRRWITSSAAKGGGGDLHLDQELGPQSARVYVRRSGKSLADPIPALYSRGVFLEYQRSGRVASLSQLMADSWVFGSETFDSGGVVLDSGKVLALYEQDYIRAWDYILSDLRIRPTANVADTADVLAILSSRASPLRRLLELTEANTNLTKPFTTEADPSLATIAAGAEKTPQRGTADPGARSAIPGQAVAQHFRAINEWATGSPAPIDRALSSLGRASDKLSALASTADKEGSSARVGIEVQRILAQEAAQWPPAVGPMLKEAGIKSGP